MRSSSPRLPSSSETVMASAGSESRPYPTVAPYPTVGPYLTVEPHPTAGPYPTLGEEHVDATPDSALPTPPSRVEPHIEGLEERIGGRWLLYAGIASLILGVSYFVKFAFDNGWVSEPLRVATGLAAGGALLWIGQRFVRQGLAFFGHALSGGGLVVLYVAVYAALHVYDLIAPPLAFAAMLAVTALGLRSSTLTS